MKKEEIKKDPIRDRMLGILNSINDNPKKFLRYTAAILFIFLAIIIYSNSSTNKLNDYNLYSSINQNRYIDGARETAINNFDKMLKDYSTSESYNQAFLYSLNNAIEENDIEEINKLISSNDFKSADNTLQSLFYNILGNYHTSNLNIDQAISYYKKAINESVVDDHLYQFKLNLLYLYYNNNQYSTIS